MPSNDEVLWGIPNVQCPSCQAILDCATGNRLISKFSKAQLESRHGSADSWQASPQSVSAGTKRTRFDYVDQGSTEPENSFIVVSCGNECCQQYSKLKVLRIPRIHTPSIKVDLS